LLHRLPDRRYQRLELRSQFIGYRFAQEPDLGLVLGFRFSLAPESCLPLRFDLRICLLGGGEVFFALLFGDLFIRWLAQSLGAFCFKACFLIAYLLCHLFSSALAELLKGWVYI
jgi:hypothetical protein